MPRTHPECLRSVQRAIRMLEEAAKPKKRGWRMDASMKDEPVAKTSRKRDARAVHA